MCLWLLALLLWLIDPSEGKDGAASSPDWLIINKSWMTNAHTLQSLLVCGERASTKIIIHVVPY